MYFTYKVAELSPNQIRKLIKGEKVKLRKGNAHTVHLSEPQIKKIETAHKKGMASVIQLDPHQSSQHGSGVFGDIGKFFKSKAYHLNPIVKAGKTVAHSAVKSASKYAHGKIDNVKEFERPSGEGIASDVLSGLAGLTSMLGGRVKPRVLKQRVAKKRAGKGFLANIAKAGVKALAPIVIDKGSEFVKSKIAGAGVRKAGRPKKTTAKRVGRPRKGKALMPAGY
jgi:hypothetical protein